MHFVVAEGEEYKEAAMVAEYPIHNILLHKPWHYSKLPFAT